MGTVGPSREEKGEFQHCAPAPSALLSTAATACAAPLHPAAALSRSLLLPALLAGVLERPGERGLWDRGSERPRPAMLSRETHMSCVCVGAEAGPLRGGVPSPRSQHPYYGVHPREVYHFYQKIKYKNMFKYYLLFYLRYHY